jgi:hypothetical protein
VAASRCGTESRLVRLSGGIRERRFISADNFPQRLDQPDSLPSDSVMVRISRPSLVIRGAIDEGWIRLVADDHPKRNARYLPFYVKGSIV